MTTESLDNLAAEAAALDVAADAAAPGAAEEAPAADVAAEIAALLKTASSMLVPAFPSLSEIYNDATCRQLGEAAAPVLAKYNISLGGILDRWGPEISLAAVALPVSIATYKGVKADAAARRAPSAADAAPAAPPKPAAPVAPSQAGGLVIPSPGGA